MQDYHELEIWQRAMDYAVAIYRFCASLPEDERYNLSAQLKRAGVSVALNIAEGCGCATNPEFARFLQFSYRSVKEIMTCLELCQKLFPGTPSDPAPRLLDEGSQIARMIWALIQRLGAAPRMVG